MKRSDKLNALRSLLTGSSARLNLVQRPSYQELAPTQMELWAMNGEQLLSLIELGISIDYQKLPSVQLRAVLKAWQGNDYRDSSLMSRQELKECITQVQQRLTVLNNQPL